MHSILLVRHGQASFGQHNYDALSELGLRQTRLLGDHWLTQKLAAGHWYSGSLQRQQDTFKSLSLALGSTMAAKLEPGLNEFPAELLVRRFIGEVIAEIPDGQILAKQMYQSNRVFQKLFTRVIDKWIAAGDTELVHDNHALENWASFDARVGQLEQQLLGPEHDGSNIVAVTSAGIIAALVHRCTNQPATGHGQKAPPIRLDKRMFHLAWNLVNSSVTELRVSKGRVYLHRFNDYGHLSATQQPELVTYR